MRNVLGEQFTASPSLSDVYVYDGISFIKGQFLPLEIEIAGQCSNSQNIYQQSLVDNSASDA